MKPNISSIILAAALWLPASSNAETLLAPAAKAPPKGGEALLQHRKPKEKAGDKAEETKEKDKKKKSIEDVTKDNKKVEGLFTLFQNTTNGSVHLLIKDSQIDKEFIYFTYTEDGVVEAGHFRGNFRDTRIFSIRKHFNRIEFVAENTAFYFDESSPLSRASNANISPAILTSQEIVAEDKEKGQYLIKADGIFLSEAFHQVKPSPDPDRRGRFFSLGNLSKDKTKYVNLRSYPENTDVIIEYVYENAAPTARGGEEITDARNVSIRMQHTLIEMPQNNYQPRFDDPRVGYFNQRVTDLTSTSPTPYRDLIHRWHLEKKDKTAKLSEPVQPIVWWIENTTPTEIRPIIQDAVLAWNEAFEAAGFTNAVQVKIQPDDADWDAGDIRYNVLRWTSSPNPPFGGYGPSFVNPRTGQIIGADIMLEYVFLANRIRMGRLFPTAGLHLEEDHALELGDPRLCSLGHRLQHSTLFGLHTMKAHGATEEETTELIKESLYYLILHEVGHTLGLNHNMRSSQLHSPDEVHNRELTSKVGLTGSVMDYPAVNLAAPGRQQGQYYTTRPGPYDRWAIQFGYAEDTPDDAGWLDALLDRSTEPELAFGNDADDMRSPGKAIDPRVMIGDMSSDAIAYAEDRVALARSTMSKLMERIPNKGQSYQELLFSYFLLSGEIAQSGSVISRYIGGVYVDRAMYGQPNAGKPFTPVTYEDQKRAMKALRTHIFAPDAFQAPDELYHFLQSQRRGFDHFSEPEDPKVHSRILNIHRNILNHLLHPRVLTRLTDSRLYGNQYSLAEFMNDLTEAIFEGDGDGKVNTFRQNLQLEYVNRLTAIISENRFDHPSQSSALFQLREIEKALQARNDDDLETRAHVGNILFTIEKALRPRA